MEAAAEGGADVPPCKTLYVWNLIDRLSVNETKKALFVMFTQFGRVLEVACVRSYRLRGQAWVTFSDVTAATQALRAMQGFPFYDKPLKVAYARQASDAVAKAEGTYRPTDRKEGRLKRKAEDQERSAAAARAKKAQADAPPAAAAAAPDPGQAAAAPPHAEAPAPPHKILFVQGLPAETTDSMLSMLFQQFPGYKETRMVEAKPGIAFVEFDNDMQASAAMSGLQGFKVTATDAMNITFAKK